MKKTHWLRNTLIVLIACGLAGTILAAILFTSGSGRIAASASIQFSFNGAAEGKAPNGYPFDVSGFSSDEVLNAALEASGLTEVYTAEQLRESLTVSGVYPEKIVEQMTKYVSLLDANADNQAVMTDYRATQYNVTLNNDFDKNIQPGTLAELTNQIVIAYRAYFTKVYSVGLDTTEPIANLSEYDYVHQLEIVSGSADRMIRYANEMMKLAPEFQTDKKSFSDIAARYQGLKNEIDRLNATVTFNAVSKDQERLQKQYEMEIRTQQYQLESLTEELKLIEEQMNAYDKDGIIYISTSDKLSQVGSDETGVYDKLVQKRKEITDQISRANAMISLYQSRLDDMTGAAQTVESADEEDKASTATLTVAEKKQLLEETEAKIQSLLAKKDAITADFLAMMNAYTAQEINEKTVSITAAKSYKSSILSGAFVKKAIVTAGPFCAVGFMVCMVLLIISRRKEEKQKSFQS